MKLRLLLVLSLSVVLTAMSCKEDPVAGDLSVDLTTPNSDDGAVQFTATASSGATIASLSQACSGCKLFFVKASDVQYRGVVTGNVGAGTLFHISASDSKHPGNYSIQINAVSDRHFALRTSLSNYSASVK